MRLGSQQGWFFLAPLFSLQTASFSCVLTWPFRVLLVFLPQSGPTLAISLTGNYLRKALTSKQPLGGLFKILSLGNHFHP